jgi:hypothetical protein
MDEKSQAERNQELKVLLVDIAQIFDGWHADGTHWSDWDKSVRKRIAEALERFEANS